MAHPMSEQGQAISERLERDREYAAMSWIDNAAAELDRLHTLWLKVVGENDVLRRQYDDLAQRCDGAGAPSSRLIGYDTD